MRRFFPLAGLALCLLTACSAAPAPAPTAPPSSTPIAKSEAPPETVPTPAATPEPVGVLPKGLDVPRGVELAAIEYVQGELALWNVPEGSFSGLCRPGTFDNWQVSSLEKVHEGQDLEGYRNISVYRLDYWLHTTAPEAVGLVGGMDLTEDGWLLPTYPGATYLCFSGHGDWPMYLFMLMENDCQPGDDRFTQDLAAALQSYVEFPETAFQPEGWPCRFGLGSIQPCPLGDPLSVEVLEFVYAPDQAEVHIENYDGLILTRVVSTGAETGDVIALTVARSDWPMVNGTRVGDSLEAVATAWPGLSGEGELRSYDPTPDGPSPYYLDFTFQDDMLVQITCQKILDH